MSSPLTLCDSDSVRKGQKIIITKMVESVTANECMHIYNDRLCYSVRVPKLIEMSVLE